MPPLPALPVPVTVKPPLVPVVSRSMPLSAPFEEMLWKVRPGAPIVVLATFRAVPEVVVSVFAAPVTATVPPPVAANAAFAPVLAVTPPVKETVAPVLELRAMPVPASLIGPLKAVVPPVRFATETESPPTRHVAATVMLPVPPSRRMPSPPAAETATGSSADDAAADAVPRIAAPSGRDAEAPTSNAVCHLDRGARRRR